MARITRNARPTALTNGDRARMAAAVAAHDRRTAREAESRRMARFIAACAGIALAVALFYSAQPDTWRAVQTRDGHDFVIDYGMTISDCMARIENVRRAACELDR